MERKVIRYNLTIVFCRFHSKLQHPASNTLLASTFGNSYVRDDATFSWSSSFEGFNHLSRHKFLVNQEIQLSGVDYQHQINYATNLN